MSDQLTPYWDGTNKQFQGPGNTPSGSVESMQAIQLVAANNVTLPMGIAARPGKIFDVRLSCVTPPTGNATYTVDVKKNGTSILTAPMVMDSSLAARASLAGALDATKVTVAKGDFFEALITKNTGTGADPAVCIAQMAMYAN